MKNLIDWLQRKTDKLKEGNLKIKIEIILAAKDQKD